ncbi:MAG TPA: hypothetical protein VH120_14170, partial [Gemmataceae bacterium]|nr:hypothetical protein [Gemmataceae bacterium]
RPPAVLTVAFGDPRGALAVKAGSFSGSMVGPAKSYAITASEKESLTLESRAPSAGPRQVVAVVRLRTDVAANVSAQIAVGRADGKDGVRVSLSTARDSGAVACNVTLAGKPLHDLATLSKTMDWEPQNANGFTYHPRAYPFKDIRPGWPEDYRARIEADMATLADVPDKWLPVRIDVRPGEVRVWLDDRLVAWKAAADLNVDGSDGVILSAGAQLAGFSVAPLPATPGFEPVRIEGFANGHGFVGGVPVKPDGLPRGETLVVGGVPFVISGLTSGGNDHIDVSRSLYRQANDVGYMPSMTARWFGASHCDLARIQLRIPNRPYEALYLLAAADDKPDTVPLVSAMFFRPSAGFAETFEGTVPAATADGQLAARFPVVLANGKQVNLWLVKIPLDPGRLSAFGDMDVLEVELTKKVHQFRSYPDPILYGYHQGGLPSSVHVFGVTFGLSPVSFAFEPDKFGHVWTAPAVPSYSGTVTNLSSAPLGGIVTLATRSYDGTEDTKQQQLFQLLPGAAVKLPFPINLRLNGYHDVTATIEVAG